MDSSEKLLSLIRRELGTDDVTLVDALPPPDERTLVRPTSGGAFVVARFEEPLTEDDVRARRLEMLLDSFSDSLPRSTPRPAPTSLHGELETLAQRSGASDAVVIDAQSPVVWGSLSGFTVLPDNVVRLDSLAPPSGSLDPQTSANDGSATAATDAPVERAITLVRALPAVAGLHRGGHLHHVVREADFGLVARSFASIYVLILIFDEPFDELRAERALHLALPIIERLVLALPPVDPPPKSAGAAALPRRRRP